MLGGIEYGSVIESSTHVTIRNGRQQFLDRDVVIVELDAHAARGAAVSSEIGWWQMLRNPHLVEIIAALRTDEGLTLVLDQAACLPLRTVPRLDRSVQALVVCQTLQGLASIHESGHAHGSLGPDAVLVDRNGLARLAVPGLASAATAFHAPELAHAGQPTARADLYAAGKVLEHLVGPDTQLWAPIITTATAGSPGERYASAVEMHQAIDNVMTQQEGRDWAALALGALAAAATTTMLVASPAGTSAGSITVTGMSAGAPLPPPLAPPTTMPATGPVPMVQLRARSSLRQIKRLRLIAGGGAAAAVAALVAGLTVFNHDTASRTAPPTTIAPTTTVAAARTTVGSTVPAPTSAVASPSTTAPPAPAAFDPNALPQPIPTRPETNWLWTAPAGMTISDSTVAGDIVVVVLTDANGSATAVGLRDGVEVWRHPLPAVTGLTIGTRADIITAGDAVIVAYNVGATPTVAGSLALTSLGAANGAERWSQQLANASANGLEHGPDNVILVGATLFDDSQTAAIDSTDGHVLWDIDTAHVIGSVTDVRDDRVVVAYWRDNVSNVVDVRTGQVLFIADGQAPRLAEPVLYTMTGGFGCADPACILQGNDATTGAALWQDPDQTGNLVGVSRDGDAIMDTFFSGDSSGALLTAVKADGTTRWAVPSCGGSELAPYDAGILMYCENALVLFDNDSGAEVQRIGYESTSSNALAAGPTVYTVVGQDVTATTIGADGAALWSARLPSDFTPYTPLDYGQGSQIDSAARAFDDMLLIKGQVADGRAALAVLTDRAPAQPVQPALTLADITSGATVAGSVGPYTMADGTRTLVVTHNDPADVELAVERADGWHIEQTMALTAAGAPVELGDLNGDGRPEVVIPSPGANNGTGTETLLRVDDTGPTLIEIRFIPDPTTGATTKAVRQISLAASGHVTALYDPCAPVCGSAAPTTVDWVLDTTGAWFMHPAEPVVPPVASPTLCIRSNIDFAALRAAPDLAGELLAEIPPGSCDVTLVDSTTAQGNGFAWYHVQWNGVDGWTAKSNTA